MFKIWTLQRGFSTSRRLSDKPSALLDSIIRVDHAGELGADRIYAGQMAVLGHTKIGPVIQEMWDQEKHHKEKFEDLIVKHRVRPTVLTPFWNIAGFALGAGTALMGEKAAMACTVAVESVIVDHYNDQLRVLMAEPNPDTELLETIKKFRDEEQEHHDCGLDHGAEQAPFYQALSEVIKMGCRAAISLSKGLLEDSKSPMLLSCRYYSTGHSVKLRNGWCRPIPCGKTVRHCSSNAVKWDLASAVCIERKPLITKPLNELELRYKAMLEQIELSGSQKSDHELRREEDEKRAEMLKQSENLDADMEAALKQTAQDFEDAGTEELTRFKTAPREGKKDVRSLQRKLDQHLVLLPKMRLGSNEVWMLPQSVRQNGETLRSTADRILSELFGHELQVRVLGNAPFGFYKFKYPKDVQKDSVGVKLFIFKALCYGGSINLNDSLATDYRWVTRKEMAELITNKNYTKSIFNFLIDDDEDNKFEEKNESLKVASS